MTELCGRQRWLEEEWKAGRFRRGRAAGRFRRQGEWEAGRVVRKRDLGRLPCQIATCCTLRYMQYFDGWELRTPLMFAHLAAVLVIHGFVLCALSPRLDPPWPCTLLLQK